MNQNYLTALFLSMVLSCGSLQADVVLDWNQTMSDVLRDNTDLQNPGMASRSMAMMNLAIYDAFAMTSSNGTLFYDYGSGHNATGLSGSTEAAVAQAAHTVLSGIYADQQTTLDNALTTSLMSIPSGQDKTDGIALGTLIGQSILNRRANDGFDSSSQYMPTNAVGRWQPDPVNPGQEAWGPAWGEVQTFALDSGNQFMAPPLPDLTSQAYADAFNEVKMLGSLNNSTRTPDQTNIGLFWAYDRVGMGTPMRLYNEVVRNIAVQEANTPAENAVLFAKTSVAVADAGIAAWNSKFEFDFWRPVTGIREADSDGNPNTLADPNWTPLGAPDDDGGVGFTPPFPTYLSGHATFGGALFGALIEHYNTDQLSFSLTSEELTGAIATRTFNTLTEAMAENGRSRVYLGIHWNFDDTEAQIVGQDIAQYIFSRPFMASVPEPTTGMLALMLVGLSGVGVRRQAT